MEVLAQARRGQRVNQIVILEMEVLAQARRGQRVGQIVILEMEAKVPAQAIGEWKILRLTMKMATS